MAWKAANQAKWHEELRKSQNHKNSQNSPWNRLSMQALPRRYALSYFFSQPPNYQEFNHNFVHNFSPFGNELIKQNPREARDAMHEIKITVFHKVYK
jgi:hypothetical protein